jgi:hypothetical protein
LAATTALAGLVFREGNGEDETTTLALFCFGFFASLLLRRFFMDMGATSFAQEIRAFRFTVGAFRQPVRFV